MQGRPVTAFILSLIGSLFVIMGILMGLVLYGQSVYYGYAGTLTVAFTGVSIVIALMMLIASLMLYVRPDLHVAWGVVVLVFAVGSFTSVFVGYGGFGLGILGMVLGIIGGALAISWQPGGAAPAMGGPAASYRVCLTCGRMSPYGFAFCPFCGAPAPVVGPSVGGTPPTPPR
jgi:hypothetical protein